MTVTKKNSWKQTKDIFKNLFRKKEHIILASAIFIFFILKTIYIFRHDFLIWDETVYISMGKFLLSGGDAGYREIIRPLILPLITGTVWKAGLGFIVSKFIIVLISIGTVVLTYIIFKENLNEKIALYSSLLLLSAQTFFIYSSYILTGVLATFFMMLSIYCLQRKKYLLTGIFGGIAFLTRFPFGLYLVALAIFLIINLSKKKTLEDKKDFFIRSVMVALGIIIALSPFFIYNISNYIGETGSLTTAAFRPLLYGKSDLLLKSSENLSTISFYLKENLRVQPLILLSGFGFLLLIPNIMKKQYLLYYLTTILFLVLFMLYDIKDMRFLIPALPFLAMFSGIFLFKLSILFKEKKFIYKILHWSIIIIIGFFLINNARTLTWEVRLTQPHELYDFVRDSEMKGPLLTATPLIGAYVDIPMTPLYFDLPTYYKLFQQKFYPSLLLTDTLLECKDNQKCIDAKENLTDELHEKEYSLVFNETINDVAYIIYLREDLKQGLN